MKQKPNNLFWASYADLMTALFIVMLVLFVLSYSLFKQRQGELEVMAAQYQKLQEIEAALGALEGEYFEFDSLNRRHELKLEIAFQPGRSDIAPQYNIPLRRAGQTLTRTIQNIKTDQPVRFLVIIEGMAARYPEGDLRNNKPEMIQETYNLSYQRALRLFQFWESAGVKFDKKRMEVIIAGSGFFGAGRYKGRQEPKNKRFLIQIIPKIGIIEK
ncbi:MAG: flagellar motor protein MotB [Bacteroidota bacterium]